MHLGPTIKLLRIQAGISLRRLAREIGVTAAYLSQVENEKSPSPAPIRVEQIAGVLGIAPIELQKMAHQVPHTVASYLISRRDIIDFVVKCRDLTLSVQDINLLTDSIGVSGWQEYLARLQNISELGNDSAAAALDIARVELLCVKKVTSIANKRNLLRVIAETAQKALSLSSCDEIFQQLERRELDTSTGIGNHVAIPHVFLPTIKRPVVLVFVSLDGVEFGAIDGKPVKVIGFLVDIEQRSARHLTILARMAAALSSNSVLEAVNRDCSEHELANLLEKTETTLFRVPAKVMESKVAP